METIASIPKEKLVYVDETGIDSYLHRSHCYTPKGKAVIGFVSGRKYRRVGIVAAKMGKKILSPLQYDGTMDSMLFETWFESRLMRDLSVNSVIIMDNAAFHRKKILASIAQKYGHSLLFLPPYSPELNPIENFWAWLKQRLRSSITSFNSFDLALHDSFHVV